jgi:hypothetical protein
LKRPYSSALLLLYEKTFGWKITFNLTEWFIN